MGALVRESGSDIARALGDALYLVFHPRPLQPVCACGAFDYIENHGLAFPGQRNGLYCVRGHRLPGQDMP